MGKNTGFPWNRQKAREPGEAQLLRAELQQTKRMLQQAYGAFDQMTDPDLVDACIFEIKASTAKYDYLLRRLKQLEQETKGQDT